MQTESTKNRISSLRRVLAFTGALLAFVLVSGLTLYWSSSQITRSYLEIIGNQAMGYASVAASNTHLTDAQVASLKQMTNEELRASSENKQFAELFNQSTLIDQVDYAYIMVILPEDEIRYSITPDNADVFEAPVGTKFDLMWLLDVNVTGKEEDAASSDVEGISNELSRYGYWTPADDQIFGTSSTYVVNEDEWGKHICGYAPIYTVEGSFLGMVGVDLTAFDFNQYANSGFTVLIVLLVIVALLVAVIFLLFMRRQRLEHLEALVQEESFRILVNTTNTLTFSYDPRKDVMEFTTKKPGEDLIRHRIEHYLSNLRNVTFVDADFVDVYEEALDKARRTPGTGELEVKADMGSGTRWYKVVYASVADGSGAVYRCVGRLDDMQLQKEAERRADHDGLSGLLNRSAAEFRIEAALSNTAVGSAFILVDIDNFKQINDTMGHANGDSVIRHMGETLLSNFRSTDIIYRLGGDEFAIFMQSDDIEKIAEMKAQAILEEVFAFSEKLNWDFAVTVSVGIALASEEISSFSDLYTAADKALYRSKESGKNTLTFYDARLF